MLHGFKIGKTVVAKVPTLADGVPTFEPFDNKYALDVEGCPASTVLFKGTVKGELAAGGRMASGRFGLIASAVPRDAARWMGAAGMF